MDLHDFDEEQYEKNKEIKKMRKKKEKWKYMKKRKKGRIKKLGKRNKKGKDFGKGKLPIITNKISLTFIIKNILIIID